MRSCFAFFWKSLHKNVAFGKQLPTAARSYFFTILSSSATIIHLFTSFWCPKIYRFPLVFSLLLKSGRFGLEMCEEVMEDHVKNNNFKKQLGTAVPSCFFKVNHAKFSLFSSFFLPVSRFFIFSAPLTSPREGSKCSSKGVPDPTTLFTPKSAKTIEKLMVFCYFWKSVLAMNGKRDQPV